MKKLLLVVLGPFIIVAGAALAFVWWERGAPPGFRPPSVDVTVDTINRDNRGVRLGGTGHLEARLKQTSKDGGEIWWLYPLLNKGDTTGREIHVLLRTQIEPNRLYSYEDRDIEGFARPPGRLVDSRTREVLLKKGYSFANDFVLVEEWPVDPDSSDEAATE
jgi:hypothetical protein